MKRKIIGWIHWFLYGEWKIEVKKSKNRSKRKGEPADEKEIVATPFIAGGYNQKAKKEEV